MLTINEGRQEGSEHALRKGSHYNIISYHRGRRRSKNLAVLNSREELSVAVLGEELN